MARPEHAIPQGESQWRRYGWGVIRTLALFLSPAALLAADGYAGSAACANCHPDIARRYSSTPMARSSGFTSDVGVLPKGDFTDAVSGIRYRIVREGSAYRLEFSRGEMEGRRVLEFFVGSGAAGRSFLWRKDQYLFQAPVTWYAVAGRWDISPGYEGRETLNLSRPIEPECLNCHASRVQSIPQTANGYRRPPFLEAGVGCERCHGPGAGHAARPQAASIVNPARLAPSQRDSVCAQCHLTGVERIEKAGRSLAAFRPGDDLAEFAVSFVWSGRAGSHVTSHYEKLEQSRCKQQSGNRLWCGTCHAVHAAPAEAERTSYYREKCLGCHAGSDHARENHEQDCIGCHMPRVEATDVKLASFTDHSIPRTPEAARPETYRELTPFRGTPAGPRERGLAYARIANRDQRPTDYERAFSLLKQAQEQGADDAAFLTVLAWLYDRSGDETTAAAMYVQVREKDPSQAEAAVNLGAIYAKQERLREAIQLWKDALRSNPGLEAARIKLASAYLALGDRKEAEKALLECLEFHPDSPMARRLLQHLSR